MSDASLDAVIAKLTYMTHGRIGVDWRTGKSFSLHDKGDEFEALCEAAEALRLVRAAILAPQPSERSGDGARGMEHDVEGKRG